MSVSLDKFTAGVCSLFIALAAQGPGLKFIRVQHVREGSCLDASAEVLFGGEGVGVLYGDATRGDVMRIAGIVDEAMKCGRGHFAVVTEHPTQPGRLAALPHLTVTRYLVDPEHGVRHVLQWAREEYGQHANLFAAAERVRLADDGDHIRYVADILANRRGQRRHRMRAAARLVARDADA